MLSVRAAGEAAEPEDYAMGRRRARDCQQFHGRVAAKPEAVAEFMVGLLQSLSLRLSRNSW